MLGEVDPEHLHDLPLVPVGRGEQVGDGGAGRVLPGQGDLQPDVVVVPRGEQVGDHLEPVGEIHAPREVAVVAGELRLVPQEGDQLPVPLGRDRHHGVPALVLEGQNVVTELRPQAGLDLRRWQSA
jgi:hypothetical protein